MPFSATDILLGFALPGLFSGGVFTILTRLSAKGPAARFRVIVALVGGFLLGYFSLQLGPLVPESHWQWLPCVMLMSLAAGPVCQAPGVTWLERVLLYALVALVAGGWLVPTWEDLQPSRATYLAFWTFSVVVLAIVLEPLTRRVSGSTLALVLFITMSCAAGVLALSGSLRFAQIAGAAAGALAGLAVACRFRRDVDTLAGCSIGVVLLLCGVLLVGQVNSFSSVPLASYLLLPLAPLTLWLLTRGPLARITGAKRVLVGVGLPLAVSLSAFALAAIAEL